MCLLLLKEAGKPDMSKGCASCSRDVPLKTSQPTKNTHSSKILIAHDMRMHTAAAWRELSANVNRRTRCGLYSSKLYMPSLREGHDERPFRRNAQTTSGASLAQDYL